MYQVYVTKISVRPHPGADRLQLGTCRGYQIVTGLDTKDGDLGLFFQTDGQLSEEFAKANDLVRRKDENGNPAGGAQKLRGEKSDGFWIPISSLAFTKADLFELKEGVQLGADANEVTVLNGIPIAKKYETPATRAAAQSHAQVKSPTMFVKHVDTEQLRDYIDSIPIGAHIIITEKMHGTCVPWNARVRMFDGSVKKISQIHQGEYVLGADENNIPCPSLVNHVWAWGQVDKWVRVSGSRFSLGRGNSTFQFTCTPDHLVFTENGYVEAQNLKTGNGVLMCRNTLGLSEIQKQVLLGKMLGDGTLAVHDGSAAVEFGHKIEHEGYVDWTLRGLQDLANPVKRQCQSGYGSTIIRASSRANYWIKEAFTPFMLGGVKQVPEFVIGLATPLALAFWYMDDGNLAHSEGQEDRVSFAVCGFDDVSCQNLVSMLGKFGVISRYERIGKYNRLFLNADNAERLFLLVSPYIPPCMQYKLPRHYRGHAGWLPLSENVYKPGTQWQTVISVSEDTKIESRKWDIETETHNFFASDILVHNSHRFGLVLDDTVKGGKVARFFAPLLARFGFERTKKWVEVSGTRNTVIGKFDPAKDFYKGDNFRENAISALRGNLRKGELVFGEIVGYTEGGALIMGAQDNAKLNDKAIIKQYGPKMVFDYGQAPGTCKLYVYRIAQVNEDGFLVEYNWNQIKERCAELGVDTVRGVLRPFIHTDAESLLETVQMAVDGPSLFDSGHIREGVVVRVDSAPTFWAMKYKSHLFGMLEGYLKNDVAFVDTEEAA
jgi:hypothetical protein